jgi:hypothetical protein
MHDPIQLLTDHGCTPEEENQAEWNAILQEELAWRQREDQLEMIKEMQIESRE